MVERRIFKIITWLMSIKNILAVHCFFLHSLQTDHSVVKMSRGTLEIPLFRASFISETQTESRLVWSSKFSVILWKGNCTAILFYFYPLTLNSFTNVFFCIGVVVGQQRSRVGDPIRHFIIFRALSVPTRFFHVAHGLKKSQIYLLSCRALL